MVWTRQSEDVDGWAADVDALLAERDRAADSPVPRATLPACSCRSARWSNWAATLSASRNGCDVGCRPAPDPHALLGTAFHDWVQRFFHAERLFDLDDLPGAVDRDARRRGRARRAAGRVRGVAVGRPHADRCGGARSTWSSAGAWSGGASTRCSPTTTAAPRWWTGRRATRRTRRKPSSMRRFSSRCTGWHGRQLHGCP